MLRSLQALKETLLSNDQKILNNALQELNMLIKSIGKFLESKNLSLFSYVHKNNLLFGMPSMRLYLM